MELDSKFVDDVPSDHPAAPAVGAMLAHGIMDVDPGGAFAGERLVTRYDLAEALSRLFVRLSGGV